MDVYSLNKDHGEKNVEKEVGNVVKLMEIKSSFLYFLPPCDVIRSLNRKILRGGFEFVFV